MNRKARIPKDNAMKKKKKRKRRKKGEEGEKREKKTERNRQKKIERYTPSKTKFDSSSESTRDPKDRERDNSNSFNK